MTYVALYREWRPQTFEDIVGQAHITKTLTNALKQNRVAHAYLFSGPRGTGKTSSAKVLAKAVNCLNPNGIEPCKECSNCISINDGSSMDVIEIDAASNRGIDEIRELREKVKFAPAQGKFKVYIIDEVHMLTTEAFNALLKTLEEPPGHVIFILATTEPHKIPATILSRCQRFDFHRITQEDTVARLIKIAGHAGMEVAPEALELIARTAEGGLRDAVSTLDQCSSFGGGRVTVEEVESILGMAGDSILKGITGAILNGDIDRALVLVQECSAKGKDHRRLALDLINYLRNLLVLKVCPSAKHPFGEMPQALVKKAGKNKLISTIEILSVAERDMKWSTQPRILLEVALIKACAGEGVMSVEVSTAQPAPVKVVAPQQVLPAGPEMPDRKQDLPGEKGVTVPPFKPNENLLNKIKQKWPEILDTVKKVKASTYAYLIEGTPLEARGDTLVLGFDKDYGFHRERIEQKENRQAVESVLRKVLQKKISLTCSFSETVMKQEPKEVKENPVYEALELFGGQIVDAKD